MSESQVYHIEERCQENILPVELPNKNMYYDDLSQIEYSLSGRMDPSICNVFILEAVQQLVNAIELFEKGYFDCAYYSLRSAIDISTTMVFLSDLPEDKREVYLNAWKSTDSFPMQRQMIEQLSAQGYIFADMKEKMPDFFSNAKQLNSELNKFLHKQGLKHFYICRNHPINQGKSQENFIKTFEGYLRQCIGVVAVMRLAVDPFPILLMDEEFTYRCFDSITEPYSDEFVEKYIGMATLECYKKTDVYRGYYNSFINEEKKTPATFDLMKYKIIDLYMLNEILSQLHLLTQNDCIAVLMVAACDKIVTVYDGMYPMGYTTNRKSNRQKTSWDNRDFVAFSESPRPFNQAYDEAYISVFQFGNETFFAEHNKPLSEIECKQIVDFVNKELSKTDEKPTPGRKRNL